jgi:hypothetical protein
VNPLATAPATAATSVNALVKGPVPSDDMFSITRPAPGDRVQQGQLVVAATPPKIGATSVTVLELRWMDAPPNQPYVSTFAVETPKLLQGYPVDQGMTQGRAGRWEVRARIAAQPTPGPWSFPVPFQLFSIQPMQSQQQAPPPPSGSATTQMKRSPSMIVPRGVEGTDGTEDKKTVGTSPEPEKKP